MELPQIMDAHLGTQTVQQLFKKFWTANLHNVKNMFNLNRTHMQLLMENLLKHVSPNVTMLLLSISQIVLPLEYLSPVTVIVPYKEHHQDNLSPIKMQDP